MRVDFKNDIYNASNSTKTDQENQKEQKQIKIGQNRNNKV